jgi:hypothetical protein
MAHVQKDVQPNIVQMVLASAPIVVNAGKASLQLVKRTKKTPDHTCIISAEWHVLLDAPKGQIVLEVAHSEPEGISYYLAYQMGTKIEIKAEDYYKFEAGEEINITVGEQR